MRAPVPYFNWLASLTGPDSAAYSILLKQMHTTPFEVLMHRDANRGEDGKELREEYENTFAITGEDLWEVDGKASVLEVLLGLSRRLEFDTDIPTANWFWKLLENLELRHCADVYYNRQVEEEVYSILMTFMHRAYSPSGVGGLFPLRRAEHDQRRVEIWYQMQAYLLESESVANVPR